ncbi:hypothetical protein T4E_6988 [Trichinella pseudospiralis]|uniref:Uncharacterized protein n=1 Tax=Trichinella pseudospiralis TaxID=6337 RepID=A0A0V0YFJ5_TRIPS|nr:hypothetical protein T4E_6988 [Trichinella pseudospiralis]
MSLSAKQPPTHSNSKIFTEDVNPNVDSNSIIQSLEPLVCLKSCQIRPAVRAIAVLELFYAIIAASLLKSFRNCDNGTRICKAFQSNLALIIIICHCILVFFMSATMIKASRRLNKQIILTNLLFHCMILVEMLLCIGAINWLYHIFGPHL